MPNVCEFKSRINKSLTPFLFSFILLLLLLLNVKVVIMINRHVHLPRAKLQCLCTNGVFSIYTILVMTTCSLGNFTVREAAISITVTAFDSIAVIIFKPKSTLYTIFFFKRHNIGDLKITGFSVSTEYLNEKDENHR